ncbi:hypothetical protein C8F01DRAFT_1136398 [Mycena amicta]|nr:hypothetical protein C8F01DRAFT_1136398 [Mycena amicta]
MANRVVKNFLKAAGRVGCTVGLVLCLPILFCIGKPPLQLEGPEPLPSTRIDIHSRPQVTQPESCTFLHDLPLELRRFIYEEALGWRQVRLFISKDARNRRRFVNSRSATSTPISIALLCVCRQIYVEAHQILFENNIFEVFSYELNTVMLCGLGESVARPYIRKLRVQYWYHPYDPQPLFDLDPATRPFKQIAAMPALSHLTFQFVEPHKYDIDIAPPLPGLGFACDPEEVLDSVWARGLLGTRIPNLQQLEIKFEEADVYAPEYLKWQVVERTINELMVGQGAEERCQQFLKDRAKSKRTGEDIV